jgi:DNA-binding NarL/FixJ family response regulator
VCGVTFFHVSELFMSMHSILLVEDHLSFAELIVHKLSGTYAVTVAASIEQAHAALASQQFRLVLMDLKLQNGQDSFGLIDTLRVANIPVIVVSGTATHANLRKAIFLEVAGYFDKASSLQELLTAISSVLENRCSFPVGLLSHLLAKDNLLPHLSPREITVLDEIIANPGQKATMIGEKFDITSGRIRIVIANIRFKFDVNDNYALIAEADRRGYYPKSKQMQY